MTFPPCATDHPLGIYPIVDQVDKLKPLYDCGITTAQLRVKDKSGESLEEEILAGIALSRSYKVRFFVNDHWEMAVRHGAYGVHLGQEDIQAADIAAIHAAGLRLGISSHTPNEINFALSFSPSYLAIGPIYPPISKELTYPPVGADLLQKWSAEIDVPIVAIGGITLDNIAAVAETKVASGIAMISAVMKQEHIDPKATRDLMEAFAHHVR